MGEADLKDFETLASHRVPKQVLILAVPAETPYMHLRSASSPVF